jgi:hypothetical protein
VADVCEAEGAIIVRGEGGAVRHLPFRAGFLGVDCGKPRRPKGKAWCSLWLWAGRHVLHASRSEGQDQKGHRKQIR